MSSHLYHTNCSLPRRYNSDAQLKKQMAELEQKHLNIASFDANDNEAMMLYPALRITDDVCILIDYILVLAHLMLLFLPFEFQIGSVDESKLHILIFGSFFDSSPLGREMTMNLARHVVAGYSLNEPIMVNLLKNTVIHFMPITTVLDDEYLRAFNLNQSVCDPIARTELADKVLSTQSEQRRDILLHYLEHNRFDLVLSFAAGGFDVQVVGEDEDRHSVYAKLRAVVESERLRKASDKCPTTPMRMHQIDAIDKITDLFATKYHTPLFTIQLDCCKMPPPQDIAKAWRRNLARMLNFFNLTETGVRGVVKDASGHALRSAVVSVRDTDISLPVTKNLAMFRLVLPPGEHQIEISSPGIPKQSFPVNLEAGYVLNVGDIVISTDKSLPLRFNNTRTIGGGEIHGFVLDAQNHPIENARISLVNSNMDLSNTTDAMGSFRLVGTPLGAISLLVTSSSYFDAHKYVTHTLDYSSPFPYIDLALLFLFHRHLLINDTNVVRGIVFHLEFNESVMGIPRFFFVISMGFLGLMIIGCAVLVAAWYRSTKKDRKYYSFSLLPQKSERKKLFDDDDEVDETELFRTPVKSKLCDTN